MKGRNRQGKKKERKMNEEERKERRRKQRKRKKKKLFCHFYPVFCFPVTVLLSLDFPSESLISIV